MKSTFLICFFLATCCGTGCVFAQNEADYSSEPFQLKLGRSDTLVFAGEKSMPLVPVSEHKVATSPSPSLNSCNGSDFLRHLSGIALMRSPELRDAEAEWSASKLDIDDAKGARWPRVDVSANSKAKMFGEGNPYGNGMTNRATLSISYTLYDGGRIGSQISAREFQEQSAHAKYLMVREQTVYDTTRVYFQILKYRRLVKLHLQYIERLQLMVDKMEEIVQVMVGRRSELTQATSRLLQAKDNKHVAESRLRENEIQLLKLVGVENLPKQVDCSLPQIEPVSPDAAMLNIKKNHPLLLSAEADKHALVATVDAIRVGNYWPSLELHTEKMSGEDIMGYGDPGQMYAVLKWNVFQGLSGRAQERAMFERANAAQEKYQRILFEIEYNLDSAWADYVNLHERVISLRDLSLNSEQVRNDYFVQWETLGKRTLLEVLTAENEHFSTLINLVSSEIDEQVAMSRLRFESGAFVAWLFANS